MNRILNWHETNLTPSDEPFGATYYLEQDYTPVRVRLYARNAPNGGDLEVDIRDDDVSILADRASSYKKPTSIGDVYSQDATNQTTILAKGSNLNEMADSFLSNEPVLAEGSLITCYLIRANGASDITVQLELESLVEEEEESD